MCRWGCPTVDTTYMCKWCGTRYCRECLKGDFVGQMVEATKCRKCNQFKCQGARVEYVPRPKTSDDDKGKSRGKSAGRSRSASPSKKTKSAKSGGKKSAKSKSGKKRKKR